MWWLPRRITLDIRRVTADQPAGPLAYFTMT